jgi:tetratricopeptide (TPR) repeat protein
MGRANEAIAALLGCLLLRRDSAEVFLHLGILLGRQERLAEAAGAFRQAGELSPGRPEPQSNLGHVLLKQRKLEDALACFRGLVAKTPEYAPGHCGLGLVLAEQGQHEMALPHFQEALRLDPSYADGHFHMGNSLRKLRRDEEALACYARVLEIQPGSLSARLNSGIVYTERGELERATGVFLDLLGAQPNFAEAHNCLGVARLHQGRPAEALAHFDAGVAARPNEAEIHLNRALCLLGLGDYERGWEEYEWRWRVKKAATRRQAPLAWDGSALPKGTILLWGEQGMGDMIQFVRYAALVKERVGTVLVECPAPLRGLFASCPGIDGVVAPGEACAADVQAPLMSLPRLLGTTSLELIPSKVPYLFVDEALRQQWKQKIPEGPELKVGIVWQGNPRFTGDRFRSVPLEQFRPLAGLPGVKLFSLQKGAGAEQLESLGEELGITDLGKEIKGDFRETAAAIQNLDLVVSVDSSVAHLTGALKVPVWVLIPASPDWRWLHERADSVWYPSARLFRQESWGDWPAVFDRLAQALRLQAGRPRRQRASVEVDLTELVERAVREELAHGSRSRTWETLARAGVFQSEELTGLVERLRAALEALAAVEGEILEAVAGEILAAGLLGRFALAKKERAAVMADLAVWARG